MHKILQAIAFIASFCFISTTTLWANNVKITDVALTNKNELSFNVSWENSWYTPNPPSNWDAVWVFIKAQDCESFSKEWGHVKVEVTSSQHSAEGLLKVDAATDGMGVFVRRANFGFGTITPTKVTLKLAAQYDTAQTNFRVMGVEMVAVLQGAFRVGNITSFSGATASNKNTGYARYYSLANNAQIGSEASIGAAVIRTTDSYNTVNTSAATGYVGYHPAIPATFPKGFNKFYIMKYEVTQEQYKDFLNLLNYTEQTTRTANTPNLAAKTGALVASATGISARNGIQIKIPGNVTSPAVYGCNLNNNDVFDEAGDGQNIACNFLSWADLLAYLDWAALRPMTELEYEKAARGPNTTVVDEYAWGNANITAATSAGLTNAGTGQERSTAGLVFQSGLAVRGGAGPLRVGFAATQVSDRFWAGASYWGVMELTGNVSEQTYSVGYSNSNIAPFTGVLGDGKLSPTGASNQTGWSTSTVQVIVRGGSWADVDLRLRVADRNFVASSYSGRYNHIGGRGVRQY